MKKRKSFIWLILVLVIVVSGCALTSGQGPDPVDLSQVECEPREDDPEGYLFTICKYLKENEEYYPVDPNQLTIVKMEMKEYEGRQAIYIELDCCYAGDMAVIDAETGEVLIFWFGDI